MKHLIKFEDMKINESSDSEYCQICGEEIFNDSEICDKCKESSSEVEIESPSELKVVEPPVKLPFFPKSQNIYTL